MKKSLISILMLFTAMIFISCGSVEKYNSLNSLNLPSFMEDFFEGPWSIPGYVDAEGNNHTPPKENKTTGKRLNVVDFGAVSEDENYDNTPAFSAAMEEAIAGDEVYVPAGRYYFSTAAYFSNTYAAHIDLKTGVNFVGEGRETTTLVSKFNEEENLKYKTAIVLSETESNIVISGFALTSDTEDSRLPDPDVSNINSFVETAPVYGLVIDNARPIEMQSNIVVRDMLIEKYQRMGIRIRVMRDVRVSNCILQKATDLGGGGAGYGISIQGMSNGVDLTDTNLDTIHNVVKNCEIIGPYMRHGILLQYFAHNNLITNNRLTDTLLDSIDLHGEDEYSNEISYNTINNPRRGASIGVGNSGATHDASGPYNYIHHNSMIGGDRGLDVLYGTEKTIVVDNIIRDLEVFDTTGIFLQNAPQTIIRNNLFENIAGEEATSLKVLYSYNALFPEKGIPDGIQIINNTFKGVNQGIYIETHTDNYLYSGNVFEEITASEYIDDMASFELPPISDVVIPRLGVQVFPTDDNFITNETRSMVQRQSNMKFKASYYDVPYNRMIYLKFDLSEAPTNKENVYLRLSGKSKDGLVTIVINGTTTYLDWTENTLSWENALYHKDQVAVIDDPNGELTHVADFTFTTVGTEFNTYYINLTDYIMKLDSPYVTLILTDEAVSDMYCEVYSKEISNEALQLCLVYSND